MTTTQTTETLEALNNWIAAADEAHKADPENWDGRDIWTELILDLPGYDSVATDELDPGYRGDRFIAGGVEYRWCEQDNEWQAW